MLRLMVIGIGIFILMSGASSQNSSPSNIFEMPKGQDQWRFEVNEGETFTVKIKGNPTTGYGWYLENAADLNKILITPLNLNEYNSADFVTDEHPRGMVGVPGYYFFKFEAKHITPESSPILLEFVLKQPWRPESAKRVHTWVSIIH